MKNNNHMFNKITVSATLLLLMILFACNNKVVSIQKETEIGYDCYYESYVPDTFHLNRYILKYSKSLFKMGLKPSGGEIELLYGYHCFECSDKDRYMIFINFYSATEISYNKVDMEGKIICNKKITIENNLYFDTKKTIGDYVKRECGVEGGEDSLLVLRNQNTKEILSYYKSQGIEGYLNDPSQKYLKQKELIRNILAVINDCG